MDEIEIRPAVFDDVPLILHQRRSMFWDMGNHDEDAHRRMLVHSEAFLRDALPRGTYCGWLAAAGGGGVAGAGVTIVPWPGSANDPAPQRAWVQNAYTEPEYRRRGLARRLVEAAVEWCRAEGFIYVFLHASVFGRPLYESMGFQQTNEMRLRLRE
jgi:GNAT superfamily N-acetyltransferase